MPKEESKEKKGKEKKGKKVTGVEEKPESSQKTKINKDESGSILESRVEPMAPCTIVWLGLFHAFVLVFTIAALILIWPERKVWRSRETIEVMIDSVTVRKDSVLDLSNSVIKTQNSLSDTIETLENKVVREQGVLDSLTRDQEISKDSAETIMKKEYPQLTLDSAELAILEIDTALNDSTRKLRSSSSELSDTLVDLDKERFIGDPGYKVKKTLAPHLSPEANFFLIVLLAGMLGSVTASFHSFVDRMKEKVEGEKLEKRLTWGYVLRPMFGGALALVFYFVINGGLMTSNLGNRLVTPYGLAAVGALVGMFAEKAMAKLKELIELLFQPKEEE